jgi:low affinity Fe/Cu permease
MAERARRPKGTGTRPQRPADRDPRPAGQRGRRSHHAPARGPADVRHRTLFDGFAEGVTRLVSSAYFFAFCVAGVVAWALFGPPFGFSDTWQLIINTATTIMTFLMVAVLQNSSRRGERALQAKLDAIADALADFMDKADIELERDVEELEAAVGLEERVGSG